MRNASRRMRRGAPALAAAPAECAAAAGTALHPVRSAEALRATGHWYGEDATGGGGSARRRRFGWAEQCAAVTARGHRWCPLARDLYGCVGARYGAALRATAPFDDDLGLGAFPRGAVVLATGDSMLFELVLPWVCAGLAEEAAAGGAADVYYDAELGTNDLVVHVGGRGREFEGGGDEEADGGRGVLFVLLDNDGRLLHRCDARGVVDLLSAAGVEPTHVLVGSVNGRGACGRPPADENGAARRSLTVSVADLNAADLHAAFPRAAVLEAGGAHIGNTCQAHFRHCVSGGGHQCFPGPLVRHSERAARALLQARPGEVTPFRERDAV